MGMNRQWPTRYSGGARFYDVLSGERPVYRNGRVLGIADLQLHAGDRVLDIGCGTGLNFPLLLDAVGPSGAVVAMNASSAMLTRARALCQDQQWDNVTVVEADAGDLDRALCGFPVPQTFDAALFTYSLSIISRWQQAYTQALARLRVGGRILVVDMAASVGRWRVLSPLARLACVTGGADITRGPWNLLLSTTSKTRHRVARGGHIHIASRSRR